MNNINLLNSHITFSITPNTTQHASLRYKTFQSGGNDTKNYWLNKGGDGSGNSMQISTTTVPPINSKIGCNSMVGDGSNNQYVTIPSGFSFDSSGGYSISLWIYCIGANASGDIIWFELDNRTAIFLWQQHGGTNYNFCNQKFFTLSNNNWYHLVFTTNKTNYSVYINGRVDASQNNVTLVTTGGSYGLTQNNTSLYTSTVGRSVSSAHKPMKGYISDFRLYPYVLTSSQVVDICNGSIY